jgi:enolase
MSEPVIQSVIARRIWDSRGRPTVEAEIALSDGAVGRGIAPAGASRGTREAVDKRDGGRRFGGFDVQDALRGIVTEIAPALAGLDPFDQAAIDARLVALDGAPNKARLGGNALTAVSLGVLHAAAASRRLPLWLYCLGDKPAIIPLPEIQIFGGGAHAGRRTDVQDFMVIAPRAKTFAEALEVTAEVYHSAGRIMAERGLLQGVADEGGWWPAFSSNEEALETLMRSIERAGLVPGEDVSLSLDVAASEFGHAGRYRLGLEKRELDRDALAEMLLQWCARYPILSIEDPFAEDDDKGFEQFTAAIGDRIQVIGDDYLVTSASRVREAARQHSVNAALIKVNQAGTVSEAKAACDEARGFGFGMIVSARSGETEDTSIVHLAIGWGAGQLKVGSFARSERMAKWNEALRIEEALSSKARFASLSEMPMRRQAGKSIEAGIVGAVDSPSTDGRPSGRPLDRAAALTERGYSGGRAQ